MVPVYNDNNNDNNDNNDNNNRSQCRMLKRMETYYDKADYNPSNLALVKKFDLIQKVVRQSIVTLEYVRVWFYGWNYFVLRQAMPKSCSINHIVIVLPKLQ